LLQKDYIAQQSEKESGDPGFMLLHIPVTLRCSSSFISNLLDGLQKKTQNTFMHVAQQIAPRPLMK